MPFVCFGDNWYRRYAINHQCQGCFSLQVIDRCVFWPGYCGRPRNRLGTSADRVGSTEDCEPAANTQLPFHACGYSYDSRVCSAAVHDGESVPLDHMEPLPGGSVFTDKNRPRDITTPLRHGRQNLGHLWAARTTNG
ncbi:MAG: hypothetical protein ACFFCW_48680 [Candidatus Hodarchaeota archaeon]